MSDSEQVALLGSGAVGVFLGTWLEAAGAAPRFVARGGAPHEDQWHLVDARSGAQRSLRAPVQPASTVDASIRQLVVCVRGDQLEVAVDSAVRAAPSAALGLAAPVTVSELAQLRARHPGRVLYVLVPMFNVWSEGDHRYRWLQPPLLKTLLSGEGDAAADAAARTMAARLAAGGLGVRVVPSAERLTATFFTAGLPLLAAWQLSHWSARVVDGAPLRHTTARAIGEALTVVREARGALALLLRLMPAALLALLLTTLRWFISRQLLAMWRQHGPKIETQTRGMIDSLLARAGKDAIAVPHLTELRRRLSPPTPA